MSIRHRIIAAAVLAAMTSAIPAFGQAAGNNGGGGQNQNDNNNGGGGGGGMRGNRGGGGRGNWDPAEMQKRMMDNLKTQLGMSDDDFAAIEPKIEKVIQLTRDTDTAMNIMRLMRGGGGGGGRGGGPGGPGGQPQSDLQLKRRALQDAIEDKDAKPEDVKVKLDDYRAAETQGKADLSKAQDDLKGVVTPQQEAQLVSDGLLN